MELGHNNELSGGVGILLTYLKIGMRYIASTNDYLGFSVA